MPETVQIDDDVSVTGRPDDIPMLVSATGTVAPKVPFDAVAGEVIETTWSPMATVTGRDACVGAYVGSPTWMAVTVQGCALR
jgi:hypothetical protein